MTKRERRTVPVGLDPDAASAIRKATVAAGGLGVPGLFYPGLDEAGMAAIWATMVTTVARRCGAAVSPATITKLVTSALSSVAAYTLGSKILTWAALPLVAAFPIAGIPAVAALNASLNALFTYRLGKECARRFSEPTFSARDVLDIGRHLLGLPTIAELAELRDVLRSG
jgi:hypothetical protein